MCPNTIDGIAQDFVQNHLLTLPKIGNLDFDNVHDGDPWFAWRRRISSIYGVSTYYSDPRGHIARSGWNRRLWRNYPGVDPETLVEIIFDAMIECLRENLNYGNQLESR